MNDHDCSFEESPTSDLMLESDGIGSSCSLKAGENYVYINVLPPNSETKGLPSLGLSYLSEKRPV